MKKKKNRKKKHHVNMSYMFFIWGSHGQIHTDIILKINYFCFIYLKRKFISRIKLCSLCTKSYVKKKKKILSISKAIYHYIQFFFSVSSNKVETEGIHVSLLLRCSSKCLARDCNLNYYCVKPLICCHIWYTNVGQWQNTT